MKKRNLFIIALVILMILISQTSYAVNNKRITVRMDNKNISVREVPIMMDGKVLKSDSPSFVYVDRTLVSARLVAENYGAKVDWDPVTKTAIINQDGTEVKLTINNDVARVNGKNVQLDKNSIPKLVNFGGKSAKTMIPINFLSESLGYDTGWDEVKKIVHLNGKEVESVIKNQVLGIDIKSINGKETLYINGTNKVTRNILNLKNPDRMVIDLMDSELIGNSYQEYKYDVGNVEKVRVSQFIPDGNYKSKDKIVRVVLDIKSDVINPKIEIKEENNNLVLLQSEVIVSKPGKPLVKPEDNLGRDKDKKPNSKPNPIENLIDNKDVGQTQTNPENIDDTEDFVEELKDRDKDRTSRLIVVDPGHGGSDPGAKSISGVNEKDLALDISLKLEKGLRRKGHTVIMTRDDDTRIALKDRAAIANDNYADIFISIHGNSVNGKPSAKGIEVLYTPKSDNPLKGDQQTTLAKFVQEELIKATGTSDRGIKKRPNLVVIRDTKMPSILVETGFMSNPVEDINLNNPMYQDKLVEAIIIGIEKYFEIY